jgi:hypothetical protein
MGRLHFALDDAQQFNRWCAQWHVLFPFLFCVVGGLCPHAAGQIEFLPFGVQCFARTGTREQEQPQAIGSTLIPVLVQGFAESLYLLD